jgi:hypothetical protein
VVEQYIVLTVMAAIAAVATITAARWVGELTKVRKNKRTNQDDTLQPLLGVVWPEEIKTKRKKQ